MILIKKNMLLVIAFIIFCALLANPLFVYLHKVEYNFCKEDINCIREKVFFPLYPWSYKLEGDSRMILIFTNLIYGGVVGAFLGFILSIRIKHKR